MTPPNDLWIAQRVVVLLYHYQTGDLPEGAVEAMASDWISILKPFPEWAIEAACLWWLGPDNEFHFRKPLPGDIAEAADRQMAMIRRAKQQLESYGKYGDTPPAFIRR